jgi:hypothetical protein
LSSCTIGSDSRRAQLHDDDDDDDDKHALWVVKLLDFMAALLSVQFRLLWIAVWIIEAFPMAC